MSIGALAFLNPWLLAALASLPLIYWLLRTVPPKPKQVPFPPTRILAGLENKEKTPAKTPWWLMLIRLLAAALVILALADPVFNPSREGAVGGTGPVVIAIDNGWASAPRWSERMSQADSLIAQAEAGNRPVVVAPTAKSGAAFDVRIEAPADARATLAALRPQPFAPDRMGAAAALDAALGAAAKDFGAVWLSDGIDHGGKAAEFAERLRGLGDGEAEVVLDAPGSEALGAFADAGTGGRLEATVMRSGGAERDAVAHAFSERGERLGEASVRLGAGQTSAKAAFDMPLELRNQVTRVEVAGERSAGAVSLLDARSQWRRIGLLSGESREQAQPLLGPLYYIERALTPYVDLIKPDNANLSAGLNAVMRENASALVLADIGTLSGEALEKTADWVERGGVLIRFAGVRLEKGGDELLPAPLRIGGRTLGGALSWSTPQPLAAFEDSSPFAGLDIPADVAISRQVLADPARLSAETAVWARLKDGTPLVTAIPKGRGRIVLFHVTGNSDWSNLPMSGLFVEMLRRVVALADGVSGGEVANEAASGAAPEKTENALPPIQSLDGFGTLKEPPVTAQPVQASAFDSVAPSLEHPPGYYGTAGSPRTLNVIGAKTALAPLPALPPGVSRRAYAGEAATPLKPWLLAAALALLLSDVVAVLLLQMGGLFAWRRAAPRAAGVLLAVVAAASTPGPADAQQFMREPPPPRPEKTLADPFDEMARKATGKVTFGYVLTGDGAADDTSRLGLMGLNKVLSMRTAVEPGEPMAVSIDSDEIAFFPVLYWPVLPDAKALPKETVGKIDAYMKQGGMIVFDTRDYGQGLPAGVARPGQDGTALQRLLGQLDLPRLEPVPENHVVTRSFYLLRFFPGRWEGGQMWVEATGDGETDEFAGANGEESEEGQDQKARKADGVTSIVVTSNDFAAAWAVDDNGRPVYPVVPGGEMQREMSFRTGVNIVMHALTGNYKADQVHVPALLERLGQ